jgi:two-component system sensor histidine kinase QseC
VHLHNLKHIVPAGNQQIALLEDSVERMGHLIEQILALYRSSPDQASVKFSDVDLYSVAQEIIARDYDQFDLKQQSIELVGEATLIRGNRFALETLIHNLITNASKYTPLAGEIEVSIHSDHDGVCLIVEDSGPGIPEQQHKRVFERFYRLHGDRHDSGTLGCGLGLAIVKHIVDLHQAKIELAASRFSSGLKVTIVFPNEF